MAPDRLLGTDLAAACYQPRCVAPPPAYGLVESEIVRVSVCAGSLFL